MRSNQRSKEMEIINGEWYMKCCTPGSPDQVRNADEAAGLIRKVGFLPLFSDNIPGFSLEEHTLAEGWWSGREDIDPWEWRQILSRYDDIAYGKFFRNKAGFISKEWFPFFANYRRNGYDFDALFDDELASLRSKKLMDEFTDGREWMSFELKARAGFGKGGEKNFEGTLTELQMQTYLIMKDFRQKVNKKGESYGWHIAVLTMPETKWGYEYVASAYKEDPAESWNRIVQQIKKYFPDASDDEIRKSAGIRYPGQTNTENRLRAGAAGRKERLPKEWLVPANPKYYDIEHAFDNADEIDWKQGAGIRAGDTVFMYVAAPVSAVMYQCIVTETDIPYSFHDGKLSIMSLMKIRLEKRFRKDAFTFSRLNDEYGIRAVRGPRGIPQSLSEALEKEEGI